MRRRKVVPHDLKVSESSVVDSLPKLDLFPKIEREYSVQTSEGGAISIVTYIIMLVLFFSEFLSYSRLRVTEHLQVDKEAEGRLRINLNITFPKNVFKSPKILNILANTRHLLCMYYVFII